MRVELALLGPALGKFNICWGLCRLIRPNRLRAYSKTVIVNQVSMAGDQFVRTDLPCSRVAKRIFPCKLRIFPCKLLGTAKDRLGTA